MLRSNEVWRSTGLQCDAAPGTLSRMNTILWVRFLVLGAVVGLSGCHAWFLADADREVYRLIEQRQLAALGETHDARLGAESGVASRGRNQYDFVPHPVDPAVPPAFQARPDVAVESDQFEATADEPAPTDADPLLFTLADALAYALKHSREYQTAKEDLYLSALDLTLERHLWTPLLVSNVSGEFTDYGQVRDFDRAMTAVADFSVTQALPYGGQVTAQVIHSLMRDLGVHVTSAETGVAILSADLPLLRGAGRVAYESRYQAERNLIYATRNFERFRRTFLVDIASDYFALLVNKSQIENAEESVKGFKSDLDRAQALVEKEKLIRVEADRARVEYLIATNDVITTRESFETALDFFKIRLGMQTDAPLDVVAEGVDLVDPKVSEAVATETALRYRLDLLNDLDAVDDARRAVAIAKNNLLPQFDLSGSVTLDTDNTRLNSASFNTERATWRGVAELGIPLDRKRERNDYRSAWIGLRRAERLHDEARDRVRVQVRSALRRLKQAHFSMEVQRENININAVRREHAEILFEVGKLSSNRDKIEAENAYRRARDRFAAAESDYRIAILEFLLDTGTLRVGGDGRWIRSDDPAPQPEAD